MSEDFDSILNRCLLDITAGRETIDSCLRRYPAQAGRLKALLQVAQGMQTFPAVPPMANDKRRALETRLLKRAAQLQSKQVSRAPAPRLPLWRRSFAVALASVIAVTLLLGSAVSASAASVPGDVLYPVKRAAEQVRLALTPDSEEIDLHLELAQERLEELNVLQARGEVSEDLLREISNETEQVLALLPEVSSDKQQVVLVALTGFEDQQVKVLNVMASSAKGEARIKVMEALKNSTARQQQAKHLLRDATPGATAIPNAVREPGPTVLYETKPASGKPTVKPSVTEKPTLFATAKPTKVPPATPQKPTPKVGHTPPGQANQVTPNQPTQEPKPPKEPKPTKEPKN